MIGGLFVITPLIRFECFCEDGMRELRIYDFCSVVSELTIDGRNFQLDSMVANEACSTTSMSPSP